MSDLYTSFIVFVCNCCWIFTTIFSQKYSFSLRRRTNWNKSWANLFLSNVLVLGEKFHPISKTEISSGESIKFEKLITALFSSVFGIFQGVFLLVLYIFERASRLFYIFHWAHGFFLWQVVLAVSGINYENI